MTSACKWGSSHPRAAGNGSLQTWGSIGRLLRMRARLRHRRGTLSPDGRHNGGVSTSVGAPVARQQEVRQRPLPNSVASGAVSCCVRLLSQDPRRLSRHSGMWFGRSPADRLVSVIACALISITFSAAQAAFPFLIRGLDCRAPKRGGRRTWVGFCCQSHSSTTHSTTNRPVHGNSRHVCVCHDERFNRREVL